MSDEKNEDQIYPISINNIIEELVSSIENSLPIMKSRLDKFIDAFNIEFPLNNKPEDRGRGQAITWALMDGHLMLYGLNMKGSAIIELHGILERFVLQETVKHFIVDSKKSHVIKVFERCTLPDLASSLREIDILDDNDIKFARKLTRLRNGLAHKNPRIISNVANSGKKISVLDIDSVITEYDCIPLIIDTIQFLIKMSKIDTKKM